MLDWQLAFGLEFADGCLHELLRESVYLANSGRRVIISSGFTSC